MSPSDVLNQAADLIERTGWCQGAYGRDEYGLEQGASSVSCISFCALGALRRISGNQFDARVGACKRLRRLIGGGSIDKWNDASGRTKKEVIATLRRAAQE
jgi:hypothetical protein